MTAVEWLEKICNNRGYHLMSKYFEQAKEMEKQQIIDAYIQNGWVGNTPLKESAEQYYNETFQNNQVKEIAERFGISENQIVKK